MKPVVLDSADTVHRFVNRGPMTTSVTCPSHARMAPMSPRFLTLADVADVLNVSVRQVYALVRNGELRGIQVGGRGQWRVENSELEDYIQRQYQKAALDLGPGLDPDVDADAGPITADEKRN